MIQQMRALIASPAVIARLQHNCIAHETVNQLTRLDNAKAGHAYHILSLAKIRKEQIRQARSAILPRPALPLQNVLSTIVLLHRRHSEARRIFQLLCSVARSSLPSRLDSFRTFYYSGLQFNRQMESKLAFWGSNQHNLLSPNNTKSFNRPQCLSLPFDITDLSASEKHIAFITSDGSLYSYGVNIDGRLGVGGKADLKYSGQNPARVKLPAKAVKVRCGFSHVCVQLANEELYAWGLGDYGSLGTGEFKSKSIPTKVQLKGRVSHFSCGAMHSGFVDSDGNIYTTGSNEYGELGVNKPQKIATPLLVNFSHKVKQIECGVFYTLLLTARGQVFGMGNNKYGQLGIGHKVNECHPTLIRELQRIVAIAAGYHSGALDSQGSLYIWGSGSFGQLLKPKKIILPSPVDLIFIRGFFGVAVSTRERRVFSWGNNTYGQLGRGNFESAKEPVQVGELSGIRFDNFACGVNFFLATSKDDKLPAALTISEEKSVHKNRFDYLPNEREERSPYAYASNPRSITPKREQITRRPLNYEAGSSTFRVEEENREIANRSRNRSNEYYYRSPVRKELQVEEARVRSRSREDREIIQQEIRRSRSRNRNYEDLFISLSADYEALLARYKTMEEHLELKNRSLAAQKQQLSMIYKEQNDILREQNALLKRQLTALREELILTQTISQGTTHGATTNSDYLKEEIAALNAQLTSVKQQLKVTLTKLVQAEQEAKATPKKPESKRIPYEVQREIEQLKDQNGKLNKQLAKLKEEFKITIEELQAEQQESLSKDAELKEMRQKKSAIDYKEEYEYLKKDYGELTKDLKAAKEELKTTNRKYDEIEEELAIKNIELKELKGKKQAIQNELKQQAETLNEELAYLSKEFKITKEELKITLKKLDSTEEELALKSLEVKDLKQKRLIYDATEELKLEIMAQRDQNTSLAKENKTLKEELRNTLRKEEETEQELAIKTLQAKDLRQKLANKEAELQNVRSEHASLSKDNKELKESLKSSIKQLDNFEELAANSKYTVSSLEKAVKSKQEEIKLLEKRGLQADEEYKDLRSKKDAQIQSHLKKIELLTEQNNALKSREKELSDSLKESSKANSEKEKMMGEREKHISQITANHKKIENELYKTISVLEEEKERVNAILDRTSIDKRQLEETLRINEENFVALQKQYQLQLSETYGNLVKLKEVQDLNEIRVGELKTIIDSDQKAKSDYAAEVDMLRVQVQHLTSEKQQLFKMIEETRARHAQDLQPYKDRIIELQNQASGHNQRAAQMEAQLSYEKEYHNKCEFTIKQLTDSRDQVCREQETLRGQLQREREKVKDLTFEVEKNKTFKKEIEVLTLQLERVQSSTKEYKREIQQILQQKEEIIKEQRSDLQKKQREVDSLQQKYDNDTGALQRQIKDGQKKLSFKSKECADLKKEMQKRAVQTDNLKDSLDKTTRKLAFKNDQLQKEMKEHERTTEEFNNLRREHARLKSDKEDLEGRIDQFQHEKRVLQGKISDRKKEAELLQSQIRRLQATCENLRKENELSKKELEESNWALEESNRVNDQLSRANKEFAENQEQFTNKISDLQGRIFQLQDQNRSYTPRYDALMQRNRELDERNRQLSQMINKAIEIQAEAYKTNILKQVEINTGEILQQIKEEQEFKSRGRRKETPKEHSKLEIENLPASSEIHKAPVSKIKDEPYTKLMNEKISVHKKKVSESAQKLAGILDIHGKNEISDIAERQSEGKEFSRTMNLRREEDYEKINSQMQSLNQQKQDFMQKISSFAEKLKIL